MRRVLLIPLAIVVALPVAGLAAARFYLDQAALRARVEAAVQNATGRALTIAGPIRLAWSLTPTIEANDLSLANPPGFSHPTMAHVDRVDAAISLLPLLSHRLEVHGLTITGPDVRLERDAQGRPNWDFSRPAPTTAPSAPAGEPSRRLSVDLGEIALRDARLSLPGLQLAAPRLSYDPGSGRIAGDLLFRGAALRVAGTAGPVTGGKLPLDLHLEGSGLQLALAGSSAAVTLRADAPDLASLSSLAGATLPPLRDVRLDATATFAPASIALDGLKLSSAQGDLAGTLVVALVPRPTLHGAISSTHIDLDALTPAPPSVSPPGPPSPGASPSTPAAGSLIPDTPIPFALLRSADADLQLDAAALAWRGRTYTDVAAHVSLQAGKLRLDPAGMAFGDKRLSADIQADAAAQTLAAKIDAPGLPAGPVSALLGGPANTSGTVDVNADLHGRGATWHAAASSLQGNAGLAMVDGEIDNGWLLDKLHDALRAANLPITAGGDSKVRCAAIRAEADSGKVTLQALALDTSKLELDGTGDIDLAAETLDLHLRPTLRLGAALSVPVHVGGTLRAPKIVLDPGAISPGRVGISIGGPPPPDLCGPALASARGGQEGPAPAPEPAKRPLKPADLLRALLR